MSSRSSKKGPFVDPSLVKKIQVAKAEKNARPIQSYSRRSVILPEFVGVTVAVHNGQKFVPIYVTEQLVGHKFGEFAPTRKAGAPPGDRKSK